MVHLYWRVPTSKTLHAKPHSSGYSISRIIKQIPRYYFPLYMYNIHVKSPKHPKSPPPGIHFSTPRTKSNYSFPPLPPPLLPSNKTTAFAPGLYSTDKSSGMGEISSNFFFPLLAGPVGDFCGVFI